MTDLSALFALLNPDKEVESAIAESDPYLPLKQAPDLVSQVLMKSAADPQYGTGSKILAGLLSGLGSGYLGGLSSDYQTRSKGAYAQSIMDQLGGNKIQKPDVLSQDVFNIAGQNARKYDIFQGLQDKQDIREFENKKNLDKAQMQNDLIKEAAKTLISGNPQEQRNAQNFLSQLQDGGASGEAMSPQASGTMLPQAVNQDAGITKIQKIVDETGLSWDKAEDIVASQVKEDQKDWYQKLPADTRTKLDQNQATVNGLQELASTFEGLKSNWPKFQINSRISGKPENNAVSLLKRMLGNMVRLSGDVGNINENEQVRHLEATVGNWTSNSADVGVRLREGIALQNKLRAKQLYAAKAAAEAGGGDAMLEEIQRQMREEPVGSVDGQKMTRGISDQMPVSAANQASTKVIGGVTYKKVPGGWLPQ